MSTSEGDGARPALTVVVGNAPQEELTAVLEDLFGEAEDLDAVLLWRDSGERVVTRLDVVEAIEPVTRGLGLGASDGLALPGTSPARRLRAQCPVDGERFVAFFLEPGEGRVCPHHPDAALAWA